MKTSMGKEYRRYATVVNLQHFVTVFSSKSAKSEFL